MIPYKCPKCGSSKIQSEQEDWSITGYRRHWYCLDCGYDKITAIPFIKAFIKACPTWRIICEESCKFRCLEYRKLEKLEATEK